MTTSDSVPRIVAVASRACELLRRQQDGRAAERLDRPGVGRRAWVEADVAAPVVVRAAERRRRANRPAKRAGQDRERVDARLGVHRGQRQGGRRRCQDPALGVDARHQQRCVERRERGDAAGLDAARRDEPDVVGAVADCLERASARRRRRRCPAGAGRRSGPVRRFVARPLARAWRGSPGSLPPPRPASVVTAAPEGAWADRGPPPHAATAVAASASNVATIGGRSMAGY